jgi:hypothetical protein
MDDVVIKFKPSAFKHGCAETDIRHALMHKVYAAPLVSFPEKYGVIGFDTQWNPIEVLYNPVDDDTISVFHAMKLRKVFLAQLDI